jgi:hypothetical protein
VLLDGRMGKRDGWMACLLDGWTSGRAVEDCPLCWIWWGGVVVF